MSLAVRRIIFYLLLTAFLIIAPVLTGYTAGYRWSSTQKRLVKIGALSVKTEPAGTQVSINGKPVKDRTPVFITNLIPGIYTLNIRKDGYHEWQKTLTVESERTTFAHGVVLFRNAQPDFVSPLPPLLKGGIKVELTQSHKNYRVFYDPRIDKIVVVDNEKQRRIAELPGRSAIWHAEDRPMLFTYSANEVWQYEPGSGRSILITRLADPIKQVILLPKIEATILILEKEARALELDLRDRQNSWTLAAFDEIKTASLAEDGKTLLIEGTRAGKEGVWKLELQ